MVSNNVDELSAAFVYSTCFQFDTAFLVCCMHALTAYLFNVCLTQWYPHQHLLAGSCAVAHAYCPCLLCNVLHSQANGLSPCAT